MPNITGPGQLLPGEFLALETLIEQHVGRTASATFLASHNLPLIPGDDTIPEIPPELLVSALAKLLH